MCLFVLIVLPRLEFVSTVECQGCNNISRDRFYYDSFIYNGYKSYNLIYERHYAWISLKVKHKYKYKYNDKDSRKTNRKTSRKASFNCTKCRNCPHKDKDKDKDNRNRCKCRIASVILLVAIVRKVLRIVAKLVAVAKLLAVVIVRMFAIMARFQKYVRGSWPFEPVASLVNAEVMADANADVWLQHSKHSVITLNSQVDCISSIESCNSHKSRNGRNSRNSRKMSTLFANANASRKKAPNTAPLP